MRLLFIDGAAGASGDMLLAALADAAGGRASLEALLNGAGVRGFALEFPVRRRGGVEAIAVRVIESSDAPSFPTFSDVEAFVNGAALSPFVKEGAIKAFRLLAEAEARAHRVAHGHAHFHEVGAVDAVVDVVGTYLMLECLNPQRTVVSPLRLGRGYVKAAHGILPIPAPATAELLAATLAFGGDAEGEFTTPTGAALIASFADEFGSLPAMTVEKVGYGPGTADPPDFPNVLRAFVGDAAARDTYDVAVVETNIDDMTAEELAAAARALEEAGALDVTLTPVLMKKGRPGFRLTALVTAEDESRVMEWLLARTTTLGVRAYRTRRRTLSRRLIRVVTAYGEGSVKIADLPGGAVRLHAEYEDAVSLAARAGVPLRDVTRAMEETARASLDGESE